MGYLNFIEAWLNTLLGKYIQNAEECKEVKQEIKAKIYNSYRNGQRDCPRCNPEASSKHQEDEV